MHSLVLFQGLKVISATLTSLSLSACSALGCNDVSRIVKATPNLISLSLCDNFPLFNQKSLHPIGQLVKLEKLNLSQNPAVNDDAIHVIVDGCKELKLLNLSGKSSSQCVFVIICIKLKNKIMFFLFIDYVS